MFDFPNINPVAIDLGIIRISWYAISYIAETKSLLFVAKDNAGLSINLKSSLNQTIQFLVIIFQFFQA